MWIKNLLIMLAEFLSCLSLHLGFAQLVPLSNCLFKTGILQLVCVGCWYYKVLRVVGC